MKQPSKRILTVVAAGTLLEMFTYEKFEKYFIYTPAPVTLLANQNIVVTGTPGDGSVIDLTCFGGQITLDGFTLTINSVGITQAMLTAGFNLIFVYNGAAWKSVLSPNFSGVSFIEQPKIANNMDCFIVPISFESGEQCSNEIHAPCNGTFTLFDTVVTKAIAGTDDGTITPNIDSVDITGGLVTLSASSALNTLDNATPSAANVFTAGQKIRFVGAKTTAGGKCLLTARYTRT